MLELRELSFHYPHRPSQEIISSVSLTLREGELVALVGPNGSGKSTLLKLAAGLLQPIWGEVITGGRSIVTMSRREVARQIAFVGQVLEIRFPLTVLEFVLTGRYPHVPVTGFDHPSDILIARQSLQETDALHFSARRVGQLSAGEKQRVALARALAQEPQWMLLDEPTSNADLAHQVSILALIRSMTRQRGIGVIFVTHDLNLAAEFADRVVFFKRGHLVASGSPAEVMTPPVLSDIFDLPLLIDRHPHSGNPRVYWQGNIN